MNQKGKLFIRFVSILGTSRFLSSVPTAVVLLLFSAVCLGESPRGGSSAVAAGPVPPDRKGPAPNQSVSLDDSEASALAADAIDPIVETEIETNDIAAQNATRVVRRAPRDVEFASKRAPTLPAVPWYRSGLGALGIVLAVISGAVWCVRRWMPTFGGVETAVLKVVGRAGLSPKHSVALVSLGQRFVLVGLSGDRMTRICEVSDPQEVADLTLRLSQSTLGGSPGAFEPLLAGEVNEYADDSKPATEGAGHATDRLGDGAPKPLNALLKRLRSLQMK